ncbi:TatD family [Mycotypha africana]|uniref:TatD family n=1 Tax=Mycotypha africana TaxID=64632 RepID=UPI00230141E8|nr:TatD family [Mycotypha africana]KAI8979471.1 TatD family [Mycotypha africana]
MCQLSSQENEEFQHKIPKTDEEFDPSLFPELCDAHCHPHDDVKNLLKIAQLKTGFVTLMGVRQDDWDTVAKVATDCLNGKSQTKCIPSFGIHPWFSHFVTGNTDDANYNTPRDFYKHILASPHERELDEMIDALPDPVPYNTWYSNLRQHLLDHPNALVGEVGVDRSARLLPGGAIEWHNVKPTNVQTTIDHQLAIFNIQCQLARKLDRSISVHCVQGQGHLFDHLKAQSNQFSNRQLRKLKQEGKPIPNTLRLCLHSFGGAPATVKQFLELKGFEVYVSFSVCINARHTPAKKLLELIKAVPDDRLLIESDINKPDGLDICMMEISKIVAYAKGWTLKQTAETTKKNWKRFVNYNDETDRVPSS